MRCFTVASLIPLILTTLATCGCGLIDIGTAPTPLGDLLAKAAEERSNLPRGFQTDGLTGEAVQSLSDLAGCWATYVPPEDFDPQAQGPVGPGESIVAYQFDGDAFVDALLIRTAPWPAAVTITRGRLVPGDEPGEFTGPLTAITTRIGTFEETLTDDLWETSYFIQQISADEILLQSGSPDSDARTATLRFRRIECP